MQLFSNYTERYQISELKSGFDLEQISTSLVLENEIRTIILVK